MEKHLKGLAQEIQELINLAKDTAQTLGFNAYLIGGFVRDLILGVKNLDLDIAIEGDGIKFSEAFAKKLNARLISHKRFGTATVTLKHHLKIDIATTRKEYYPEPGCLPVVNKGALKDDLYRRDFTINTLAISISGENFGKLIDPFNGRSDIEHKNVRILHNLSFIDDPTRILRAIRFEQRYNFKIEHHTLKCLKDSVGLKMLSIVQPQRLRDEIILILKEKRPSRQIRRIQELANLDFIKPGLKISEASLRLFDSIDSQICWFKSNFTLHRPLDSWLIYFMALIDSQSEQEAKNICQRFVLRKGEEKRILSYFGSRSAVVSKLSKAKVLPSTVFHILEPLSYEVILLIKAGCRNKKVIRRIEDFFHLYNGTNVSVSGHDLNGLGIEPGPHYQQIFSKLLNAKLNGKVKTKSEELEFARKLKNIR